VIANKSKTPGKEKNNQGVNTGEKKKKNEWRGDNTTLCLSKAPHQLHLIAYYSLV
jgi:hypothetical protein